MKLKQVIASILTDLTKAQSAADAYSREIKAAYKDDPSLRLMPVPRAEIKEIKLDLKIAFLKAGRVVLYERPNYQGKSQELLEGDYTPEMLGVRTPEMSLKVSDGMKITIRYEQNSRYFEGSHTNDVPHVWNLLPMENTRFIVVERISTNEPTDDLEKLDVEILADELKQIPESALSSISITLNIGSI